MKDLEKLAEYGWPFCILTELALMILGAFSFLYYPDLSIRIWATVLSTASGSSFVALLVMGPEQHPNRAP